MMRTLVLAAWLVAGMAAAPLAAAEVWLQASVVLKHPNATILPDKGVSPPSIFQIGWPATVKKTDGTWALLVGTPGFERRSKIGWVQIYDLVNGNDDPTTGKVSHYYTSKIEESPNPDTRATWYWLRGIYWDNNNDPRAAIKDYALAILDLSVPFFVHDSDCKECKDYKECQFLCHLARQPFGSDAIAPGESPVVLSGTDRDALLSDCYRRLGTALATVDPVCTYCCWKKCFKEARARLVWDESGHASAAPRLYYEWGNAYVNALQALYGPGALPSEACTVPADLSDSPPGSTAPNNTAPTGTPPTNSPAAVKAAVKQARVILDEAVKGDPQFADAHAALGDLTTTYAYYLASAKKTLQNPDPTVSKVKAGQIFLLDSPRDELPSAIDEYRDAIQCDSGSNRGYLGRSQALQLLAYVIADNVVTPSPTPPALPSPPPPLAGCQPCPEDTSTACTPAPKVNAHASVDQSKVANPAGQKAQASNEGANDSKPTSTPKQNAPASTAPPQCPCCWAGSCPDPVNPNCSPNDPTLWSSICRLAVANAQCPNPPDDIAQAFAKVSTLLADAADSAQLGLNTKDLSDLNSVMQLSTTLRDLALLNDATPTVAFQYAASAFNLADNAVGFADKIEDGDALQSVANKMKQLYGCYAARIDAEKKCAKKKCSKCAKSNQPTTAMPRTEAAAETSEREQNAITDPRQFNFARIRSFGRGTRSFGRGRF
jgi:hypothetical protein